MSSRRHWLVVAAGLVVVGAGFVGYRVANLEEGIVDTVARPAVDWPIRVDYSLTFNNGTDLQHESRLVWQAESLLEWTTVQICCGDHEVGTTMRVMADGRVFFGGYDGIPIRYSWTHEPHDGMVPIPDFGPKYPTDLAGLQALDYMTVIAHSDFDQSDQLQLGRRDDIANSLYLEPGEILGYRIEAPWGYTERWVYGPLNLTLISDEYIDGAMVRHLEVHAVTTLKQTP